MGGAFAAVALVGHPLPFENDEELPNNFDDDWDDAVQFYELMNPRSITDAFWNL